MNNKVKRFGSFLTSIFGLFLSISCINQFSITTNSIESTNDSLKASSSEPLYKNLKNINEGKNLVFHFNVIKNKNQENSSRKNNAKKNTLTEETIHSNPKQLAEKKLPYRN